MDKSVRPEIYGVMSIADVESQLRRDKMPAPFIRRMRVINLLSALTLRKIEDNMIAPFEVMDIHHVLNEQISQDAIIAMLENKNLALALETGDLQPLWVESKEKPLLRKGFEQGWMQRFNKTPFDPICVMLAMRAKLMLDVVDEEGHSYDLLRAMGMGWIDFGEIPGEEAGDPDTYVPPIIDQPIDYPDVPTEPTPPEPEYVPGPGEPGYIPPADLTPDDPGYTTEPESPGYIPPADLTPGDPGYSTEPGSPGYIPPGDIVPGEPGYVPGPDEPGYIPPPDRVPGDPGYPIVSGESPGYPEGWDEAIHPGHPDYDPGPGEAGYAYPGSPSGGGGGPGGGPGGGGPGGDLGPGGGLYGGDYGPGGSGTPGGPYGGGGDYVSTVPPAPLGYGPGWMFSGRGFSYQWPGDGIDCCLDYTNPLLNVDIEYETDTMGAGEKQTLSVKFAHPSCEGDNYEWMIGAGGGELSADSGLSVEYTAPADGHDCPAILQVVLYCGGEIMDTLNITFDYVYVIAWDYDVSGATIDRNSNTNIYVTANNTPLKWAVSGVGFSLLHEETEGFGNVLYADETACGPATITVTGCDDQSAIGYVRCTTGQWGTPVNGVMLQGTADTFQHWEATNQLLMTKTEGKYHQSDRRYLFYDAHCADTNCMGHCNDGDCIGCIDCLDQAICARCTFGGNPLLECGGWCCGITGCGVWPESGNCVCTLSVSYKEWECSP